MKPDISTIYQRNETFDCILIFNLLHYYFSICIFIRFGMVQEMYFKILHARDLILVLSFYKRSLKNLHRAIKILIIFTCNSLQMKQYILRHDITSNKNCVDHIYSLCHCQETYNVDKNADLYLTFSVPQNIQQNFVRFINNVSNCIWYMMR